MTLAGTRIDINTLDANGNTLSDPSGKQYTWDFENRLIQAVVPGTNGGTTTLKYDPFGRRIYKQSPSFTSIFLYDGSDLTETLNASGVAIASYTRTQEIDETLAGLRGSTTDYYEADALGSVTSLSSSTAALANTYTYDSFGNLTGSSGTARNYFQYTGRESDEETGLYYYRTRYFDAGVGRFLSEDLINFIGGVDFYLYAENGPNDLSDPWGLCPPQKKSPIDVCRNKVLSAVNKKFKTKFTSADVGTGPYAPFQWPQVDGGTVNIDIFVPAQTQPNGISPGRYPVNWWTYIIGYGPTLHIPAGPGGLDSSSTLVFSGNQFTAHIDSAFPYNPFGAIAHGLKDVLGLGGHSPCP